LFLKRILRAFDLINGFSSFLPLSLTFLPPYFSPSLLSFSLLLFFPSFPPSLPLSLLPSFLFNSLINYLTFVEVEKLPEKKVLSLDPHKMRNYNLIFVWILFWTV
jgi:hypothetical protein